MVDTYGVKITVVRTLYLPHNADFTILQHIVIRFGNASAKSISSKPNRYWFITLLTKGTSPKTSVSHTTGSLSQAFVQQIVTWSRCKRDAVVVGGCITLHMVAHVFDLLQRKIARALANSITFLMQYCSPSGADGKPTKNGAQKCCKNYNPVCVSTTRTCSRYSTICEAILV